MEQKDIEKEAVNQCIKIQNEFDPIYNKGFIDGFIKAAEWRIDRAWHNTTEKPIPCKLLLVNTLYGGYDLCYYGGYGLWNTVMEWAYVEDLITDKVG